MPYHIERSGSQYSVVDDKGKTVGTHPTKAKASAQVRALYANVLDAIKEDVLRFGVRRSGVGDSHSGASSSGASVSASDSVTDVEKQMLNGPEKLKGQEVDINEVPEGTPEGNSITSTYKNCGCETCKAMGVDCPDCPACTPSLIGEGKDAEFSASKSEITTKSIWGGTVFDINSFLK